jgi:hypothetical protein
MPIPVLPSSYVLMNFKTKKISQIKLGMVVYFCSSRTEEAEAGRLPVQGQTDLQNKTLTFEKNQNHGVLNMWNLWS